MTLSASGPFLGDPVFQLDLGPLSLSRLVALGFARKQLLNLFPIQSISYSKNDDFECFGALPRGPPTPAQSGTVDLAVWHRILRMER
jgi:hypothetical protein